MTGWLEALDAKAFQQEQTAVQLATTFMVIFNGCVVGLFAIYVFKVITTLINVGATLW